MPARAAAGNILLTPGRLLVAHSVSSRPHRRSPGQTHGLALPYSVRSDIATQPYAGEYSRQHDGYRGGLTTLADCVGAQADSEFSRVPPLLERRALPVWGEADDEDAVGYMMLPGRQVIERGLPAVYAGVALNRDDLVREGDVALL